MLILDNPTRKLGKIAHTVLHNSVVDKLISCTMRVQAQVEILAAMLSEDHQLAGDFALSISLLDGLVSYTVSQLLNHFSCDDALLLRVHHFVD